MGQTLVGSVQIGTPPTTANVMFDTGSPTFWVSSSLCRQGNGCPTSAGNPYNPSTSRTAKIATNSSSLTRQYGDGTSVDCVIVQDSLTIAGITIPDQNICAATSIVYPQVTQEDGLVGLAPPQVSDPADVFGNLKSAFSESKVSFWYDRNVNSLDANSGIVPNAGEITFGTPASSRYTGDFAWLPIIRTASHWSVTLNSVTVNGVTTNAKTTQSLMDTGTSLIYLSPEIFKAVNGPMGGVLASDSIYQVDCTKVRSFPDITFTFNGAPLTLTWDQQIIILQKKYCISVFSTSTDLPPIFGASFLRNFYTTFDYSGRIGFAKPTGDVTPLNVPTQSGLSGTGQNAASPSRILSPLLVAAVAAVTFASWL
nr:Vacuolar protease A [Polyrhizophydium stewartii]